ncbi:MAG: hypothetical protein ACI9ZF_002532 [Bradyrhizobium sp.]|jgi:hypothetical protein
MKVIFFPFIHLFLSLTRQQYHYEKNNYQQEMNSVF